MKYKPLNLQKLLKVKKGNKKNEKKEKNNNKRWRNSRWLS